MSDLFNDSNESFYDPSKDENKFVVIPEGEYEAHVKSLELRENVVVKNKFLSDIFTPTFKIASGDFKGKSIKAKGFFRFKTPDKERYPDLSDNSGSNKGYMNLIESLGVNAESKEVDGNTVYKLPFIKAYDIEGKPAIIKVVHDKWKNSEGEEVTTPKVINVFKWESGKEDTSDLPF
mgnify:CR=1 FL=1|jgi:hypothetical protein|tara:strand:+ start:381 stop:911 length:531 start_codon:yes stop_codon:yes gene_type:complete